jgi:hypothetical protein
MLSYGTMREPNYSRPEDRVIEAFVKYLGNKIYPGLQVTEWPDKRNTRTADIDAIAEGTGRRIAIEHTSIDSLPDQRLHNDRFMNVIGRLEDELKGRIHCHLRIITPFGAVPIGIPWDRVRDRLRMWILRDVPSLRDGEIRHNIQIEGVPFPFTMQKSMSGIHGLFAARSVDEDTGFHERLQVQIDRKALKLAKYIDYSDLRILLIENDDIANMNRGIMIKAVRASYPHRLPTGLDRIWHADSSIRETPQFWNITPASRADMMRMTAREELERPPE